MKFSREAIKTLPHRMPATTFAICEGIGMGIGFALIGILWLCDIHLEFPFFIGILFGSQFLAVPLLIKWANLAADGEDVPLGRDDRE